MTTTNGMASACDRDMTSDMARAMARTRALRTTKTNNEGEHIHVEDA